MNKVTSYLVLFALIALVYHLNPWRPGLASGEGFDAPLEVTLETWDKEVVQERKPVLVMFHDQSSATNGPLHHIIEDTQEALRGRFKVTFANLSSNRSMAMRYRITSTPTLLLFKNGLLVDTLTPENFESFPALESKVLAYCDESY